MSDLANRVAAVIPHKWNQVAIQLQLSTGERKAIEKDKTESSERFMAFLSTGSDRVICPTPGRHSSRH